MKIDLLRELDLPDLGRIGPGLCDVPDNLGAALVADRVARAVVEPQAAPKTAAAKSAPRVKAGA